MRRPGRRGASLAITIALLALVLPSGAQAFYKSFWGPGYITGSDPFPIFQQLGVQIVQEGVNWSTAAPTRPAHPTDPNDPAYHWDPTLDAVIANAATYNMRVLLQVIFTPRWANGGRPQNWTPRNPADFANFATAAARRYPSVHLWMVWGEPDRSANFEPLAIARPGAKLNKQQQTAPHNYAKILDATYGALKRVSRANVVFGGCTFASGNIDTEQWIQNLRLPNGKPPRMDIYSHNPFGPSEPRLGGPPSPGGQVQFSDLPRMAKWIDRYLGKPRHLKKQIPIFLSEWKQPTAPEEEFSWWLDPDVAAKYTSEAISVSRSWKRIYGFGWIELYDEPPVENSGLLTVDGVRKPDFYAFANS